MTNPPAGGKLATVLVVDDHDDTRDLLRFVFEGYGYHVIEANDGEDAVNLAERDRPNIIVMDTNLRRVDGLEATRRIRNIPSICNVPIVFLSGRVQSQDRVAALACGANDYLEKPISIEKLERAVRTQISLAASDGRTESM